MSRTFAYARVSTADQTTENQAMEFTAAGFAIEPHRLVQEVVSGSVAAMERKGFAKLVDKLERGDMLIVTKLDRLGSNAMDVRQTVEALAGMGVKVKCLALGDTDLTSPAGKMVMQLISAMAEFEKDLLVERTLSGQARARAQGKRFGRPPVLDAPKQEKAMKLLSAGESVSAVARAVGAHRRTINRMVAKAAQLPPHGSTSD